MNPRNCFLTLWSSVLLLQPSAAPGAPPGATATPSAPPSPELTFDPVSEEGSPLPPLAARELQVPSLVPGPGEPLEFLEATGPSPLYRAAGGAGGKALLILPPKKDSASDSNDRKERLIQDASPDVQKRPDAAADPKEEQWHPEEEGRLRKLEQRKKHLDQRSGEKDLLPWQKLRRKLRQAMIESLRNKKNRTRTHELRGTPGRESPPRLPRVDPPQASHSDSHKETQHHLAEASRALREGNVEQARELLHGALWLLEHPSGFSSPPPPSAPAPAFPPPAGSPGEDRRDGPMRRFPVRPGDRPQPDENREGDRYRHGAERIPGAKNAEKELEAALQREAALRRVLRDVLNTGLRPDVPLSPSPAIPETAD